MTSPTPSVKRLSEIKSKLLRPSLTSHFICNFQPPPSGFINARVENTPENREDYLSLSCSEASLPGSSLATIDVDNDRYGVSEKHAYRRIYDDRSDFTFYVDGSSYFVIRFFESWIGLAVNEQYLGDNINRSNYSYKVNYPNIYRTNNLSITKFERDLSSTTLRYNFVNAYPISISSMLVSYDSSQLLKCTVSFTYTRYWIDQLVGSNNSQQNPNSPGNRELDFIDATNRLFNRTPTGFGFEDGRLERASGFLGI
jgi:hypothetical protein